VNLSVFLSNIMSMMNILVTILIFLAVGFALFIIIDAHRSKKARSRHRWK